MRRVALAVACVVLFAPSVRGDLVSHWKFDGDLTDSGPGGNHGTYGPASGEPVFVAGVDGLAMSFNGSSDFVRIAQTTKLPAHNLPAFTITFFVKGPAPTATPYDRKVFSEASTTNNNPLYNLGTANASGNPAFDPYVRTDTGSALLNHPKSVRPVFDNRWHHVAWIDNNGAVTLYIDGMRDSTNFNYTRGTITTNTTTFGAIERASVSNFLLGLVDDVRLYDHALSQEEVIALAQVNCDGDTKCTGLAISGPPGGAPGLYTFTASAADASGDASFAYNFLVKTEAGTTVFERIAASENSISIGLGAGRYVVSVTVDDEARCLGVAPPEATCTEILEVVPDAPRLVSRWSLDGNANDSEASGNDGLVIAGADATPPQYVDGFDGTPGGAIALSGDDYIQIVPKTSLPIYVYPSYSIAVWVRGGLQSDKRVYSEGSSYDSSPLLNIGTDNTGATGSVDIFIRNNTGAGNPINHRKSARPAFDGNWHHIAWVDDGGWASVYVDGVRDSVDVNYTRGAFVGNRISLGAILRATPAAYFTGAIDEVRVYNYALSAEEVAALVPEPPTCPGDADTHLTAVSLEAPEGNGPGTYKVSAEALDDSGDPVLYTFVLRNAEGRILKQVGPGAENTASFDLQPGTYRIGVTADDDLACKDLAADAVRELPVQVFTEPHLELANWLFNGNLIDGISGSEATFLGEGGPVFGEGRDCKANGALSLDGVDDMLLAGPSAKLPLTKRADFSISVWVKALPQSDRRIFSESSSLDNNFLYNLGTDNTGATASLDFFMRDGAGTTVVNHAKSARPVMDGIWHHVVWIDANGTVACYIDGALDETNFSYVRSPNQTQDVTTLGGIYRPLRSPPASHQLAGAIDDVRLFNYALSEEEVLALFGAGPNCCPDTRCLELSVQGPAGNREGTYTASVTAADDTGDTTLFYRFRISGGAGDPIVIGPQSSASATFDLRMGAWRISAEVSDDPRCYEEATETACAPVELVVVGNQQLAGDMDQNGRRDIADVVRAVNILFAGFNLLDRRPAFPPCATLEGNLAVADVNGDVRLDVSDIVYFARYLFLGGPPPVQGLGCFSVPVIYGCPENPGCP